MLEQLSQDQKETVISLPYRVGVLVSKSDSGGGKKAEKRELRTLSNLLEGFTQQVFGSELLQHVMAGTMDNYERWDEWGGQMRTVYRDSAAAVEILRSVADPKEVNAYKARLLEIGEAVAMAFREEESMGFGAKVKAYWLYWRCSAKAKKLGQSYKSFDEFLNISMAEREVLQKLARALGTYYI